ncbi:MAG: class I SAM-dependent methyltransferase [Bacteroidetes bacterium]|nr:class I SAM-dependent methyltransferase [Bacteroidota bacterium]
MASERQEYNEVSPWWGEHVHRYEEAIKVIGASRRVLDIACGNGYGSFILANASIEEVVGGDIDANTIEECNNKFWAKNLTFSVIDGTQLQFEDGYFDAVVSFETIEHTTNYMDMLKEFKRVIKDSGVVIISTPNIIINSPSGKVLNPYHTQEWKYTELKEILEREFSSVQIFGQKYSRYDNRRVNYKMGNVFEQIMYLVR